MAGPVVPASRFRREPLGNRRVYQQNETIAPHLWRDSFDPNRPLGKVAIPPQHVQPAGETAHINNAQEQLRRDLGRGLVDIVPRESSVLSFWRFK